eukprot:968129-Rhodomonas_salina.2
MYKRRKLSGGRRAEEEIENEDDREEAEAMAAFIPDDTTVAVELLRKQYPTSPAAGTNPVVLLSQVYCLVKDRTEVDRQIDKAVKEQVFALSLLASMTLGKERVGREKVHAPPEFHTQAWRLCEPELLVGAVAHHKNKQGKRPLPDASTARASADDRDVAHRKYQEQVNFGTSINSSGSHLSHAPSSHFHANGAAFRCTALYTPRLQAPLTLTNPQAFPYSFPSSRVDLLFRTYISLRFQVSTAAP